MGITLWQHYINEAKRIEAGAFHGINTIADWQARRAQIHREFIRSMGLESIDPLCKLEIREFGEIRGNGWQARKLAFQILPDCWTSATYYLPDPLPAGRLPAVLYACGHSNIGILHYQPRVAMWAKRGYAALVFDTIEQHDAGGDHHGLFFARHYDWISMGYTGAGGELWNSLRALDALAAMPEVDPARIGVTGLSGGGAHSFFLAVADERIRAVASCCGVTMPRSSIEDRHLHGHCDCMYFMNIYQRCTSEFAALIAPRPLFFGFAAEDVLFSRSEYLALAEQTSRIYRLHGVGDNFRLFEYPGPHGYQPETTTAINEWFDKHLAGEPKPLVQPGKIEITERDVTVFNGAPPPNNKMRLLPEMLSPTGSVELPASPDDWPAIRNAAVARLQKDVLFLLDRSKTRLQMTPVGDWIEAAAPAGEIPLRRMVWRGELDSFEVWITALISASNSGKALVAWCGPDEPANMLLVRLHDAVPDATLVIVEGRIAGWSAPRDSMMWDALRGGALVGLTPLLLLLQEMKPVLRFLREQQFMSERKAFLYGRGEAGVGCLYHAAMDEDIAGVIAEDIPATHREGAWLPGILRFMDIDHVAGLNGPRPVALVNQAPIRKHWAFRLYQRLGCPDRYITGTSLPGMADRVLNCRQDAGQV